MAEIVNLRQARKRRARLAHEAQADAARALHGRTKAEKLKERAEREAARRHIEAHRLEGRAPKDAGKEPGD